MFGFLVREIIHTPRNPVIILRCTDFPDRECSDLGVGEFVNPYELLDEPLYFNQNYSVFQSIWVVLQYK